MNRSLTTFAFLSSLVCCIHASEPSKSPLPEPTDSLTASISSTPSEQEYQDNNTGQPMDVLTAAAASSQDAGSHIPVGHFGSAMRENPFDRPGESLEAVTPIQRDLDGPATEEPTTHSTSLCCSTRLSRLIVTYVQSWWSSDTASEEAKKHV